MFDAGFKSNRCFSNLAPLSHPSWTARFSPNRLANSGPKLKLEETTAAVAVAAEASQGAKRATEASEDASKQRRLAADRAFAASWALEHHKFAAKVREMMPVILKKVAEEENAKQARRMEHRGVNGWIMSIDAWCMWFRQTSDIRSSPTCVQKAKVRLLFRRST